ncbi:MAG: sulfotransferase [Chthoniobacterales bacterium]|nr:sulfotransferase [Chthoniobacterales bacterium]
MRGYTTLLSHILGSHPEISGYTETGRPYRTTRDLLGLRFATCHHGNYKKDCTYVLDKILHNKFYISEVILRRNDVSVIFMVREPLSTLRSVVSMPQKNRQPHTEKEALQHYAERLKMLIEMGGRLRRNGKSAFVIRAEDLISKTETVLRQLATFLQLRTPLDEHYSMFNLTGTRRYGDPSSFILEGKIERRRPKHAEIKISDPVLDEATTMYQRCLTELCNAFPQAAGATSEAPRH